MPLRRLLATLTTVLVTVFIGFLMVVQFRTQIQIGTITKPPDDIVSLNQVLIETEKARSLLQQDVLELRQRIANSNMVDTSGSVSVVAEENRQLQQFIGMTSVSGPGVVIYVSAATTPKHPNITVISMDLLVIVNELQSGGAEATSVNDQRLIASSEIRETRSYIQINQTPINPPYIIKAIGDPDILVKTLMMRGGIVDNLTVRGVVATVVKQDQVQIPAFDGTIHHRFAAPVKKLP